MEKSAQNAHFHNKSYYNTKTVYFNSLICNALDAMTTHEKGRHLKFQYLAE